MARQQFEVGQRVAIRHQGSWVHWTKQWYAAVVESVTTDNKEVRVRAAVPNQYGRDLVFKRTTLGNNRGYIDGSGDRIEGLDFDYLDRLHTQHNKQESDRRESMERREREDAENLERGWARLVVVLGGIDNAQREVLDRLISVDALRSYGAKEAVSA